MLRWTPEAFWKASTWDAIDAWEGYAVAKGIKRKSKNVFSSKDIADLRKSLEQEKLKEKAKNAEQRHS